MFIHHGITGALNMVIVLIDYMGFSQPDIFGGPIHMRPPSNTRLENGEHSRYREDFCSVE